MAAAERNWARNLTYSSPIAHPASVTELQEVVAGARRVKALGTRHSFSDCADTADGVIVALDRIDPALEIDRTAGTATVGAAIRVGDLGRLLADQGLALANLPSLPHISLGGAVATATHGSGDGNRALSGLVTGLEAVGADGELLQVPEADVRGAVVALGALGVVTRITVAVEPAFDVRQDPFDDVPWSAVEDHLDDLFAAAYSVSLFPRWSEPTVQGALVKSRTPEPVTDFFGARPAETDPAEIAADTKHTAVGSFGPSWDRLPHFRIAAVPSVGEELQSEYAVPRAAAPAAIAALRELGADIDPALHVTEIRSVAADEDWLSPASGTGTIAIGFTWRDEPRLVLPLLPRIEERLLPLGARPHWAKLFAAEASRLQDHYPRWRDFAALRDRVDPDRVFGNAYLERVLGA